MDAKSWRVRLSLAEWRRHSHSNTDINAYRDTNCDGNHDTDTETYTFTQDYTVAEAASYPAAATIARS